MPLNEQKAEIMLDLSLSNAEEKSVSLFSTDQTPTPTRFIKNCEEVGLFDDVNLQNVNPFEETFRRAIAFQQELPEQSHSSNTQIKDAPQQQHDEDSLHTPQVFPQLETPTLVCGTDKLTPSNPATGSAVNDLDMVAQIEIVSLNNESVISSALQGDSSRGCGETSNKGRIKKYRSIAEKPSTQQTTTNTTVSSNQHIFVTSNPTVQGAFSINVLNSSCEPQVPTAYKCNQATNYGTAIPVQTVKPLILPKTHINNAAKSHNTPPALTVKTTVGTQITNTPTTVTSPSSASLTPTSQLPIKERLKAIIHNNNRAQSALTEHRKESEHELKCKFQKTSTKHCSESVKSSSHKYDEQCMARRRAAATRYRDKMRNEFKELRKRNADLQADNQKLRERIIILEQQLSLRSQQGSSSLLSGNVKHLETSGYSNLQIPPSTIHLVMNIPKILVPSIGPPMLQNPLTYVVEKKSS